MALTPPGARPHACGRKNYRTGSSRVELPPPVLQGIYSEQFEQLSVRAQQALWRVQADPCGVDSPIKQSTRQDETGGDDMKPRRCKALVCEVSVNSGRLSSPVPHGARGLRKPLVPRLRQPIPKRSIPPQPYGARSVMLRPVRLSSAHSPGQQM